MHDPIKAAQLLNEQLGILDGTQIEQIRTLTEAGDKTSAVNVIEQALRQRLEEATRAGAEFNTTTESMSSGLSNLWHWLGNATSALVEFNKAGHEYAETRRIMEQSQHTADPSVQQKAQWAQDSADGAKIRGATPEGIESAQRAKLAGSLEVLKKALEADTQLQGAHSAAVQCDRDAIAEYQRALDTFIPSAEKAHRIARLDAQLAEARHSHDQRRIADLTRQKELLNLSGKVMSPEEANQRASDAGAVSGNRASPKGHADVVAQWQADLRAQEIASGEFFKDQTSNELKFWQGKIALTQAGSKEWVAVQAHIFEASKALAHQDYQDHLATLNAKIVSDRNNWTAQQADWNSKLSYIRGKYGEESAEYKNAYREFEQAQHEHNDRELQQAQQHAASIIATYKRSIDAQAKVREEEARASELLLRANSGNSPGGDVQAEVRIGQIHAQILQQKLADNETFYTAQSQSLNKQIAEAEAYYHGDRSQYQKLLDEKTQADEQYAARKAELDAQMRLQGLQDILAVQQAYHRYVDGIANSSTAAFTGLLTHQTTWAQATKSVYGSIASLVNQKLSQMVSNWIVNHVLMTGVQHAAVAAQTGAVVAGETAKTAAVGVGTAARTATEAAGAATSVGISATSSLIRIGHSAAVAAAGAYSAIASIPIVGPVLAPIAAAAALAGVIALGKSVMSAEGGMGDVPYDNAPFLLHKNEMVLPADIARPLRQQLRQGSSFASSGSAGSDQSSSNGGDIHHHHYYQINTVDAHSVRRLFMDNRGEIANAMRKYARDGGR